jgi:hypothetical protein
MGTARRLDSNQATNTATATFWPYSAAALHNCRPLRVKTRMPPERSHVSFRQLRTFGRVGDPLVKLAHLA